MRRRSESDCERGGRAGVHLDRTIPLSMPAVTVTWASCVTVNLPVALITHELPSVLGASASVPTGNIWKNTATLIVSEYLS